MTFTAKPSDKRYPHPLGMTLLELTIVILVLMSLISVLFVGAQAWKRGSDRASCVINIHMMQKAVRSYSNLYGYREGDNVTALRNKLIGDGSFVEQPPTCPGGGVYEYGGALGEDTIPQMGELYLNCSFGSTHDHQPPSNADW